MKKLLRFHRLFAALALGATLASCAEPRQSPMEPTAPSELLGIDLRGLGLPLVPILTNTIDAVLTQVVGPAGGLLSLPGGSSLSIPPGALTASTTINASQEGGVLKVEFGPEGLVFPDSALPTLTFSYAGTSVASAPVIVYLDSSGSVREVLETEVDPVAEVARAKVHHFSTYALATD